MNIVVCVKRVPDSETKVRVGADGKHLDPQGVQYVLNPYDEFAVEEALRLKEAHGGEVTVLGLGPADAGQVLRTALAMGADKAVHLTDEQAADRDNLAVAKALVQELKERPFDVLLFGRLAIDDQAGAVGPAVAALMDLPCVVDVVKLSVDGAGSSVAGAGAVAHRSLEGREEVYEMSLPAVFTAQKGLNEPRYASLKGIMAAKKKPFEAKPAATGEPGVTVEAMVLPPAREAGKIVGTSADAAPELVRLLREEAKVI